MRAPKPATCRQDHSLGIGRSGGDVYRTDVGEFRTLLRQRQWERERGQWW